MSLWSGSPMRKRPQSFAWPRGGTPDPVCSPFRLELDMMHEMVWFVTKFYLGNWWKALIQRSSMQAIFVVLVLKLENFSLSILFWAFLYKSLLPYSALDSVSSTKFMFIHYQILQGKKGKQKIISLRKMNTKNSILSSTV